MQTACGLHVRTRPAQSNTAAHVIHISRLFAILYIDSDCVCLFVHYGFRDFRVASAHLRQRPKSILSPPAGQSPHYLVRLHIDLVSRMTYDWVHISRRLVSWCLHFGGAEVAACVFGVWSDQGPDKGKIT